MFNALDIPLWYYLISAILSVVVWMWKKDWKLSILIGYLFLLLTETILIRTPGLFRYELRPFWSWSVRSQLPQIIANIVVFIPVGLLIGNLRGRGLAIAIAYSVFIEIAQLVSKRGLFEFDDIIHNTIGALIGIGVYGLIQ